jgi:hypothetical protein
MLNTNKQTNKQTNTLIIYYYPSRKYFPVLFNKNQEDNILTICKDFFAYADLLHPE